jgi:magnesium transporter
MIHCYKKHSAAEPFQEVRTPVHNTWVHVDQPSPEELSHLVEQFGLDANIVRDVSDRGELPRAEFGGDNLYVFLRPATRSKRGGVVSYPLLAIITPTVFITITSSVHLTFQDFITAANDHQIRTNDRAELLLLVMNTINGQYESLVQHTGNYIQDIRHKLQNHEVGNQDFVHFVTIEDNLNEYQVNLQDMLTVTDRLSDNIHKLFATHTLEELDDAKLYIKQLLSSVASHNQTITSIRNAYSTIANNTLNQRMKTLTVFTVLIALPNVFYGMYGMNVPLPFQESPWAYGVIVLFTVMLIFGVYGLAKRFRVF